MPDKIDVAELEKDKRTWKTECECNLLSRRLPRPDIPSSKGLNDMAEHTISEGQVNLLAIRSPLSSSSSAQLVMGKTVTKLLEVLWSYKEGIVFEVSVYSQGVDRAEICVVKTTRSLSEAVESYNNAIHMTEILNVAKNR